ncbi:phenylacetate--CoA ligase family protein [Bowmanella dokdonensis]|uniref:Phenylacetate--CoA ligase family protein n=1 Tax=Bowmanella dokdonensis TaxID=751969 RepID=A0A939IT20_9ALTE|nr:AMP-binding protein [Bowmanella dokdonensis]MBN7827327.1 phenylacetate--CoA ligase family protein [Bowmanella dokdonensis]
MSLYTGLVSSVLFPLHEKLKKHDTLAIRKSLEQSQWLSADQLHDLQAKRLSAFVENIYRHVPYYRQVMEERQLTPADIQNAGDLRKLPFLSKNLIREHFEALKSDIAGPLNRFNTGGSSGQPLIFLLGNERVSHDVAEKWRATRWWGVDIGDREIVAWGSPIELGAQDKIRLARDKLFRSELIPAFDMTREKLLGFIERIRQVKPAMLFGYPSVFDLLAKTAEQNDIRMDNLGIRVAFVTSERLYPYQRENISRVFGCPVANGYGGRDAGFIAHECPQGGMHLSFEDIVVEIVDPQGTPLPPGQSGEIVVTHLGTSEFPFVRYRTGDIAALSDKACGCGRGLPMLESIEGRSTDFVVAADGTMMHGLALIYILRDMEGVDAFKITQESLQHTHVDLVVKTGLTDKMTQRVQDGFKARLGQGVDISVCEVSEIPAEKSGKYRYVVSKVAS